MYIWQEISSSYICVCFDVVKRRIIQAAIVPFLTEMILYKNHVDLTPCPIGVALRERSSFILWLNTLRLPYIHVPTYIYVYVCVCVCMCVHIIISYRKKNRAQFIVNKRGVFLRFFFSFSSPRYYPPSPSFHCPCEEENRHTVCIIIYRCTRPIPVYSIYL